MEQRKEKFLQVNMWTILVLTCAVIATCLVVFNEYVFGGRVMAFFDVGSDTIQQYVPQYSSIVNMLRNGTFALWNSSEGFGINMFLLNMTNPALVVIYALGFLFGTEQMTYFLVYVYIGEILLAGISFTGIFPGFLPCVVYQLRYALCTNGYSLLSAGSVTPHFLAAIMPSAVNIVICVSSEIRAFPFVSSYSVIPSAP